MGQGYCFVEKKYVHRSMDAFFTTKKFGPLPIHDAIIVPVSAVDMAKRVMLHTFEVKTRQEGVVDVLTLEKLEEKLQPQLPLVA